MAGTSMKTCSTEELQKARADLEELVIRSPIPDEFKFPGADNEEDNNKKEDKEKEKEKKKKKKKKTKMVRWEDVQLLLSYQCQRLPEFQGLAQLEKEDKEKYKDLRTLATVSDVFLSNYQDNIAAAQEIARRQLATQGYVTYEITDDEADEEEAAAPHSGPRGGVGGRRRHRPGVAKLAGGGVKKLN